MTQPQHLIGYARVSTEDQNLQLQLDALAAAGVAPANIYKEKASGASVERRAELRAALKHLRAGDKLVVWKLDRLGRNLAELLATIEAIKAKGADFQCITQAIDTTTPHGRFTFHIFAALAEFQRELARERTMAGLRAAAAQGRKGGRRFSFPPEKITEAQRLMREEGLTPYAVGKRLGISASTVTKWKKLIVPLEAVDDPREDDNE